MERALGRPLLRTEVVHHIDGNPKNNAIENLIITTQSEHCREHMRERWSRLSPAERDAATAAMRAARWPRKEGESNGRTA